MYLRRIENNKLFNEDVQKRFLQYLHIAGKLFFTAWKFKKFSATNILREINFDKFRAFEVGNLTIARFS